MLYQLLCLFLVLLIINFFIADCDFFNPTVIFCFMNLMSAFVCCIATKTYDITLHANTFCVLVSGVLIFTFFNLLASLTRSSYQKLRTHEFSYIVIQRYWIVLIIIFEIIVTVKLFMYVKRAVISYYGTSFDFFIRLGKYDSMVKFHGEDFRRLRIREGPWVSRGVPLCRLLCVVLGAITINNKFAAQKYEKLMVVATTIPIIMSLLSGSRSTAFRLLTTLIAEYVIMYRYYTASYKKGNIKLLIRILMISVIVTVTLVIGVGLIGRVINMDIFQYMVCYIGGPFLNLDIFLQKSHTLSSLFGQETFQKFYSYIGLNYGIDSLVYDLNLPYQRWRGIDIGNVYTMCYMFIQDFGYWGVLPLTSIVAIFYNYLYKTVMFTKKKNSITPALLLYSYMFNDVVMLTFSNRFYENILSSTSIKMYAWFIVIWIAYKKGVFRTRIVFGNSRKRSIT